MTFSKHTKQSSFDIVLLIFAAEAIFILPFVLQRIFRPTFLKIFNINNEDLGYCFSVYGIIALFSYLFGGAIADRYHPKNLMSVALLLTAMGGVYFATYPEYSDLKFLYGYWGFTTIFLFWAAMIKATRIWGGLKMQGRAFGFLDGGRGLVAAGFGSLGVLIFSIFIDVDITEASLEDRKHAFKYVILVSSALVALIGVLVYFFLSRLDIDQKDSKTSSSFIWTNYKAALKLPTVWLLMLIILCAYTGYKATDLFTLYASDIMKYNAIESASVGTTLLYLRPIIGVSIGFMADKSRASLWLTIGFLLTLLSSVIFTFDLIDQSTTLIFYSNILMMALGVYSCRVLYFATLEEGKVPLYLTGTAVGLVSIIGYTPDIFSGPLFGILLDNPNKLLGLQHTYMVLSGFSIVGLACSIIFFKMTRNSK